MNENNTEKIDFIQENNQNKKGKINIKSKKRIAIFIIIIVLLFFAYRIISSLLTNNEDEYSEVVNIKTTQVIRSTLESTTPIIGKISAKEEASIIPKIPGQVTDVYVSMGDKVQAGASLFDIDDLQIRSLFTQANEVYLNAKANFEKIQTLYVEGAISMQQMEGAKLQYETSKQSMIMAQDSLSNAKVKSPISGYVTSVNVVVGGLVSQAIPAVTVSNIDTVQIKATVSENLINKIYINDNVKVLVSAVSENPITGTITALSPSPSSGSLTYPIIVTLNNSDKLIKPGMSVEIIITSAKKENAMIVPSGAIMIKTGKTMVAIIDSSNKVLIKEVKLGIDNGTNVDILEGLNLGDIVVTTGQQYLNSDSKVNIIQ